MIDTRGRTFMEAPLLPQRQIHLDFHTSPLIPGVGADFDAPAFARTMKAAHVQSVTVFAKCHHGHLYFATKHPARHPTLPAGLDLTGSQVKALHKVGIRAPLYISVLFDEFAAAAHPEWVARTPEGGVVGGGPLQASWQVMDMASPYQDYLADQVAEVLKRFSPVDGIFFDICFDVEGLSGHVMKAMIARGLDPEHPADRRSFAAELPRIYMARYSAMVKAASPHASVYFNSRPLSRLSSDLDFMSHVEIEALPTGGWGYMYFPKNVRFARTFGAQTMGMTARFHKSWADFGGLKPAAALIYEVSQMIAHGAACSIGDQLHPRGVPDAAAYELIGKAFAHTEACEPWTSDAKPVTQIGLFMAGADEARYQDEPGGSNDGAVRMLTQLKHQFDVITAAARLESYDLLILPDSISVDPALAARLSKYVAAGGSLLLSGTSGLDADLLPVITETGVTIHGMSSFQTTYIRFGKQISAGVPAADHVMYERTLCMKPGPGATTLARVVEPYFDRSWRHFSSHCQTPPRPTPSPWAAAICKGRIISIACPVFKAYGKHASIPYRQLVENCIDLLMPKRIIRVEAPSSAEVTVTRQKGAVPRTVVHILYFPAERRTDALDIAEDIVPLHAVHVSLLAPHAPRRIYCAPSMAHVPFTHDGERARMVIPSVEGHQMVVIE
jgi:hypothetical protein